MRVEEAGRVKVRDNPSAPASIEMRDHAKPRSPRDTSGLNHYRALVRGAWFERKVAADYSTGMGEGMRGTHYPPRAWVVDELGLGGGARCGSATIARGAA